MEGEMFEQKKIVKNPLVPLGKPLNSCPPRDAVHRSVQAAPKSLSLKRRSVEELPSCP